MERSQRDILIDMVVDWFIFKKNKTTLVPCFTFIPKTCAGPPQTGASFNCEVVKCFDSSYVQKYKQAFRLENKIGVRYRNTHALKPGLTQITRWFIMNPM